MGLIYMYKNKINGKIYIGQTTCSLKKRLYDHLHQDGYIDRALRKYGIENFEITVLEDNINDTNMLNEREIYYIEKYKSYENGYNLTVGGNGSKKYTKKFVDNIIYDIKNTSLSLKDIGKKHGVSLSTVFDINRGYILNDPSIKYPIRKERNTTKYSLKLINEAINYLKDTKLSFSDIAKKMNVKISFIDDINRGKRKGINKNISYPIRKSNIKKPNISKEQALKIIQMLKLNDKSVYQIGEIFNIPGYTVGQINRGSLAICKCINEDYPIRKKQYKNKESARDICRKLSDDSIYEIADLLYNTNISLEEIAQRYNVTRVTISRINQGQKWSNLLINNYTFPIRRNNKI